jgi:hypothetical protein
VAFGKAILAGTAGGLGGEVVVRLLIVLGVPLGDLVRFLGTMITGNSTPLLWWPAGLVLHAAVGAVWAIFYAYFFWSTFDLRPPVQGLLFVTIPILLAGLVMLPQLALMHPLVLSGEIPRPGLFSFGIGWGGPTAIVLGHAIYGWIMGSLYTRPVGYSTHRRLAHG